MGLHDKAQTMEGHDTSSIAMAGGSAFVVPQLYHASAVTTHGTTMKANGDAEAMPCGNAKYCPSLLLRARRA